jgi:hypothetical protein
MAYLVSRATIRLNRRWFLVAGGAALAAPAIGRPVFAQATEAYGFALGDIEVLVVSDGHLTLPAGILAPSAPPEEFAALMTEIHGEVPETITPAANVAVLRGGDELVLVDNGSGNKFQPTAASSSRTSRRRESIRAPSPGWCSPTPIPTTSGARFAMTDR